MSSSDKYNTGPDDIVSKIADLERRISALETVPRLSNASIDSGALVIKDNTGVCEYSLDFSLMEPMV